MTAHPTEIMRRTLQHKYNRIADGARRTRSARPHRRRSARRCSRPCAARSPARGTPKTCGANGRRRSTRSARAMAVFEETIWNAVPEFCRSLDRTLRQVTGRGLPLDVAPIRFGSWIGGDRDGNPSVTPDVTRRAALMSRWTALSLYAREIEALRFELSMTRASRGAAGERRRHLRTVPRRCCASCSAGVEATLRDRRAGPRRSRARCRSDCALVTDDDLAEPLRLCDRSLRAVGNDLIADGRLADVLRRVAAFGSDAGPARRPAGSRPATPKRSTRSPGTWAWAATRAGRRSGGSISC